MWIRNTGICTVASLVLLLGAACNKAEPNASRASSPAKPSGPVATVHWVGIRHLENDPNAAGILKFWRLRDTQRLLAQTLDKLALAPWRLSGPNPPAAATNYALLMRDYPAVAFVRPLLDDLVLDEWHLQILEQKDQTAQLALAVKLNPQHAGIWETNLRATLETSKGPRWTAQPSRADRRLDFRLTNSVPAHPLLRHIELARAGDWTILGFAPGPNAAFTNLLARIQNGQPLSGGTNRNAWLETALDLPRLGRALGLHWDLPEDWPAASFTLTGDGRQVLTQGYLTFPQPLPNLEPWNIPTNLIHEPVQSFTAVQAIEPWLSSWSVWQDLRAGRAPNQLFCWAQSGSPFLNYAAAPLTDARAAMTKIGPMLIEKMNPTLATNRMGKWEHAPNSDEVIWRTLAIAPFVRSSSQPQGNYLLAGLAPFGLTNGPPPVGTFRDLLGRKNLVYFDSEITGPRIEAWLYVGQLFRIIFRREQLPTTARALDWLQTISPLLGPSSTSVSKTGPNQLTLSRSSTLGLTAPELHLLVDWLESTEFPCRPHSVVARVRPPSALKRGLGANRNGK